MDSYTAVCRISDAQCTPVGEEGRLTARMEENDIVVPPPPAVPHERDQSGEPLAGIDRIEHESFERTRQPDRLDGRVMRDAVSRPGVPGHDLHIPRIEWCVKQVGSGLRVSD